MPKINYYQEFLNECIDISEHKSTQKIMKVIFQLIQ